jgi:A/G-specific adenine glycosylase
MITLPISCHFWLDHRGGFVDKLLEWWPKNARDFPWRKTQNPYYILIAETLLRKTTAKQVEQMYPTFLEKYPSPSHLALADLRTLRKILKPLGLENRRAASLKKLAQVIVAKYGGAVPRRREELMELPVVGRYATNAVLCFAYGTEAPLVDTNVVRIITRFFSFESRKTRLKDDPYMWMFAESLLPAGRARDFNLALLDFAAQVCRARNPKCGECIVRNMCKAISAR